MIRLEIVGNRSIQEDLFDFLRKYEVAKKHTLLPEVHGTGTSGPRKGDHVWPEENFILIVYCDREEAGKIRSVVDEVKKYFPDEGLKIFATKTEDI